MKNKIYILNIGLLFFNISILGIITAVISPSKPVGIYIITGMSLSQFLLSGKCKKKKKETTNYLLFIYAYLSQLLVPYKFIFR